MNNLALEIIDEVTEQEGFLIDCDSKAEWALKKIQEEQAEANRIVMVCENMILEYERKKWHALESVEKRTAYLREQLQQYFEKVERKKTKTQESYKLPSGTLKLKYQQPEILKDDEKLLEHLKANGKTEYVKVKESIDWAAYKKELSFLSEKAVDENGEIIPGITVLERSPKFEIEGV